MSDNNQELFNKELSAGPTGNLSEFVKALLKKESSENQDLRKQDTKDLKNQPAQESLQSAKFVEVDFSKDLTFSDAIIQLKAGNKLARKGWNGKNMFIVLMPSLYLPPFNTQDTLRKVNDRTAKWIGEDQPLDCQPYIAMYTADKKWQPGWLASQADILAEDWEIVS